MPWIDSRMGRGGAARTAVDSVLDLAAENDDLRKQLDIMRRKGEMTESQKRIMAAARKALFDRVVIRKALPDDPKDILAWTRLHVALLPEEVSYTDFVDEFNDELLEEFSRQRLDAALSEPSRGE